jgi:hypothetical protein
VLFVFFALTAVVALPSAMPLGRDRSNFFAWDILSLSGLVTLAITLLLAQGSGERLERMLDRLASRGVLHMSRERLDEMKEAVDQRAVVWVRSTGLLLAAAIVIAFASVISENFDTPRAKSLLQLALFQTLWAYIVGRQVGRMAFYCAIGSFLKRRGPSIQVAPGHIDGAAGLAPVGAFFVRQARTVHPAAVFLAVWFLILPRWPEPWLRARYAQWTHPYGALFLFIVLIDVMVIFWPMWSFHTQACRQKESLLLEADRF